MKCFLNIFMAIVISITQIFLITQVSYGAEAASSNKEEYNIPATTYLNVERYLPFEATPTYDSEGNIDYLSGSNDEVFVISTNEGATFVTENAIIQNNGFSIKIWENYPKVMDIKNMLTNNPYQDLNAILGEPSTEIPASTKELLSAGLVSGVSDIFKWIGSGLDSIISSQASGPKEERSEFTIALFSLETGLALAMLSCFTPAPIAIALVALVGLADSFGLAEIGLIVYKSTFGKYDY